MQTDIHCNIQVIRLEKDMKQHNQKKNLMKMNCLKKKMSWMKNLPKKSWNHLMNLHKFWYRCNNHCK